MNVASIPQFVTRAYFLQPLFGAHGPVKAWDETVIHLKQCARKPFDMKKLFALVVCCILCAARGFAQYTIQISDGTAGLVYTAIANELDCPGGNSLNNIMPNANTVGCFLFKFDNSTATWMASYCASAGAWSPNLTLDPGEGAFLANPGPAFMLTFTGAAHTFAPFLAPYSGLYSSQDTTRGFPTKKPRFASRL